MYVTQGELNRALPDILAAPKDGAAIEMLCLRPSRNKREFVDQIALTREHGIRGERWLKDPWLRDQDGAPHPGIQVSILPKRTLNLVWRDRESTVHPGDTFIVDMDLSLNNLPTGQLLSVGTSILKVSDVFNTACVKWTSRYGAAAKNWVTEPGHEGLRLRGILCSIELDGLIKVGDVLRKTV
ncbi:hypothetical protein [Pseudopelagicola sp. nBUS_19]|uniref:hypothetical protein n=1 Tax=Pseudopelagicola sp. nBUS_19 TaxID=3395316 RepID=UPI003EBD7AF7